MRKINIADNHIEKHDYLKKYGTIKIYFNDGDKWKRPEIENRILTVYNVLINMGNDEKTSEYFYLSENDVLNLRDEDDTTGYFLHKNFCTLDRKNKLERLIK